VSLIHQPVQAFATPILKRPDDVPLKQPRPPGVAAAGRLEGEGDHGLNPLLLCQYRRSCRWILYQPLQYQRN
jgi:hypothetical protein